MRIGILSSNSNFLGGLTHELGRVRGHELLVYEHTDDVGFNGFNIGRILGACDTVFVDFAQYPLEVALAYHVGRTIVRAHRLEMYAEGIEALPWANCDALVFIAQHVQERFMGRLTGQRPKMNVNLGHVGVDLDKFAFAERTFEPPYRILLAGNIVPKKRQYTAIQMLADLPSDVHLWIIGKQMVDGGYGNGEYWANCGDLAQELGLAGRIVYREHLPQAELAGLMRECCFVLSTTNEEGCHTTVAEGMATGLVPLVNCWRGAEQMYGAEAIWRTPRQLYQRVTDWLLLSHDEKTAQAAGWRDRATQFDALAINRALADIVEGAGDAQAVYDAHAPHQIQQYANPRQRRCFAILMENAEGIEAPRYLDVGCGVGFVVSQASLVGMKAFGVDISRALVQEAAYRAHDGAQYTVCDVTQTFPAGPWDIVSLFDSLEHIPTDKRQAVIAAVYNNLAEGGKLLMTFPWGGVTDPAQPLEWPVHPKTVKQFTEVIGFSTQFFGPLDEQYFCIVCVKGAVAVPELPEGMGAMTEGAWVPRFAGDEALLAKNTAEPGGETLCE